MSKKYAVGSVINTRKKLSNLPRGSVVINHWGNPMIICELSTLGIDRDVNVVRSMAFSRGLNNAPYFVIYVP